MGYAYDLQRDLGNKVGQSRLFYGSRSRSPARDNRYEVWRNECYNIRDLNQTQMSFDLHRDVTRYRGAAHPMCFTDEVMQHQFPEGFKPVNIEQYDGTADPTVWIEDFLLHIHMAHGDDPTPLNTFP